MASSYQLMASRFQWDFFWSLYGFSFLFYPPEVRCMHMGAVDGATRAD